MEDESICPLCSEKIDEEFDWEWVELFIQMKEEGISKEEVRHFMRHYKHNHSN
ncbi:hypothetical protein G4V62_05875 [Bacillaceae bacterium SIJ1]|uniref:hypothetical protein n=1 Tax=Litoribacterium kuwaitense TaxID=1398745 RepID=UPI0013EC1C5F|nr:hypothetical protein [Litoribacterium kuwaitense]NGP44509.1 hypothetical protein [Litoribacterium kuwaitense]